MKHRNEFARLAAVPPLVVGVVLAWLAAAVLFATSDPITVPVALLVLYFVMDRELRWWPAMKLRIPLAIAIGAFLTLTLSPRVQGQFSINSVSDLLRSAGPFSSVNWALIGSTITLVIVVIVTPVGDSNDEQAC